MSETPTPETIEVEKEYPAREVVGKLRRLADALEAGKNFNIQIAGHRVSVPPDATIEFEYSHSDGEEEIEIELKWTNRNAEAAAEGEVEPAAESGAETEAE